jgi:hypothetical protein
MRTLTRVLALGPGVRAASGEPRSDTTERVLLPPPRGVLLALSGMRSAGSGRRDSAEALAPPLDGNACGGLVSRVGDALQPGASLMRSERESIRN